MADCLLHTDAPDTIPYEEFSDLSLIGVGGFGEVFRGMSTICKGKITHTKNTNVPCTIASCTAVDGANNDGLTLVFQQCEVGKSTLLKEDSRLVL